MGLRGLCSANPNVNTHILTPAASARQIAWLPRSACPCVSADSCGCIRITEAEFKRDTKSPLFNVLSVIGKETVAILGRGHAARFLERESAS